MARRFMNNNPKWRGGKSIDNSEKSNITNKKLSSLEPSGMIFYLDFKYDEDKYYDKYYTKKEIKRVYSELDPYGEEIWDEGF